MSKLKVGIVGCGAVGSSLVREIIKKFPAEIKIVSLYDLNQKKVLKLIKELSLEHNLLTHKLEELIKSSDLVIEATSKDAVWQIAKKVIQAKKDLLLLSIGGIITHFKELLNLAKRYNIKIYLPSGAILGLDAVKAVSLGEIKSIVLTTCKPPDAFLKVKYIKDKKINLKGLKKEKILFSGPATKAVKFFPQNINVAGILKIAADFKIEPYVKIIASPFVKRNIHEILIRSSSANILARTENFVHPDNPKTSYLVVLSVLATLKEILNPLKIGT